MRAICAICAGARVWQAWESLPLHIRNTPPQQAPARIFPERFVKVAHYQLVALLDGELVEA